MVALAAASAAFAAGSGIQPQSLGSGDAHAICMYEEEYDTATTAILCALSNDIKYLAVDSPQESSFGNWYLYGGTSRNGWLFSSAAPCADGLGCGTFVIFLNRNRTWCGYEVSETEVLAEICGTWEFGERPADDTSTPRWFER